MTEPNKPLEQMTAQERYDLGRSYFKENKFDEAIEALSEIHHNDDPEIYARALLGIGAAYQALGKLKKAIKAWSKVRHGDDPETYARAQRNLGNTYKDQNKLDEAVTAWSNIRRSDDPETYARAQLNLGAVYHTLGKLKRAIDAWSKVRHSDDPKAYAGAQYNLGVVYKDQGKLKRAIDAWSNVPQDDRKAYACAQRNLGLAYKNQGKPNEAIKAWSNISHDDDPEAYAWALLGLGAAYNDLDDPKQAIDVLSKIRREEAPEIYARAQFGLGEIHKDEGEIKQAKDAYRNVQGPFYYWAQREYRILGCPPDPELINDLRSLAKNTDKVRKSLQIIPDFESKVAHYSRASTAFSLFGDEKNDKEPSHFRLSTIRGVNDPTEGLVLNDYWDQQGIPETIHTNNTATFISCFTFNHDSLNQFRLYGKEDGREATGVSLVFKKNFFSDQTDTLEFIAGPSTDPSSKSGQIKPNETGKTESDNKKPLIGKSTLYRCIYLDPETGYWTLAQRDKSTFYREDKDKNTAENNWIEYSEKISEI